MWRCIRRGDKYVTVIIDLTPIRNNTVPARLLEMLEGRSKAAFKTWPAARTQAWRDRVEVVTPGLRVPDRHHRGAPDAVTVMDPFHVVTLAGHAVGEVRLDTLRQPTTQRMTDMRLLQAVDLF